MIQLRSMGTRNTSGVVGVNFHKASGKWRAAMKVADKFVHLGLFEDKEAAVAARKAAELRHGFPDNYGAYKAPRVSLPKPKGPPSDEELIEFLWSHVDQREEDECWPWTYTAHPGGRGMVRLKGVHILASRLAYRAGHGAWPPASLFVCHECDNPPCCNPKHLWLGDHTANMRDMAAKGRHHNQQKTACAKGHPYDEANTYWRNGRRACRTCNATSVAAYKARKRTA